MLPWGSECRNPEPWEPQCGGHLLEGKGGCIRTKARADFCILDPESLEMSAAMVAGEWAVGP